MKRSIAPFCGPWARRFTPAVMAGAYLELYKRLS